MIFNPQELDAFTCSKLPATFALFSVLSLWYTHAQLRSFFFQIRIRNFCRLLTECSSRHCWPKFSEPSFFTDYFFVPSLTLLFNVTFSVLSFYLQFQGKWFAMRFLLDTPILTDKRAIQFSTGGTGPAPQQITNEGAYKSAAVNNGVGLWVSTYYTVDFTFCLK